MENRKDARGTTRQRTSSAGVERVLDDRAAIAVVLRSACVNTSRRSSYIDKNVCMAGLGRGSGSGVTWNNKQISFIT